MELVVADGGGDAKRRRVELVPALEKELFPTASLRRKSGLEAPTMLLKGHASDVFAIEFSPNGKHLATGSNDKQIHLWNVYGDCENIGVMSGHGSAILELHYSADGSQLYTCSADKSCAVWDVEVGKRLKKLNGHTAIVNSLQVSKRGPGMLVSGGDDGTVKIWDLRVRRCVHTFEHNYQVLSVTFDGTGEGVYAGTLDDAVLLFDLKQREQTLTLEGHGDSVTGVDLSPDGNFLLSNGMDNTVRLWDARSFCPGERQLGVLHGPRHDQQKLLHRVRWSPDGRWISAGSSDRNVYIFEAATRQLVYRLPGHAGAVYEACMHPTEPIVASCAADKFIYMGELD